MKKTIFAYLTLIFLLSCKSNTGAITVEWGSLRDDYPFTQGWSYSDGIYLNEYGQLVCDGFCDEASYKMKDEYGRIYPDSIAQYYQVIDTTHYHHTLQSEAQCYEWNGTNFAYAYKDSGDTIRSYTLCNTATHSSLQLAIKDNTCIARIELNSVTPVGLTYFECTGGYIKIDKAEFQKNNLKAEFNLTFENTKESGQPMWWKGKIFTKIDSKNKNIYNID